MASVILNLAFGVAAAAAAARFCVTVGLDPLLPALALWLPAAGFFAACAGLRQGCPRWGRWLAALPNLGCVLVLGSLAASAATGLAGSFVLFPVFASGVALAAWNTVRLAWRAPGAR